MTIMTFGRSVRPALLAVLSATLMAACGGGDPDAEVPGAADATGQLDASAARSGGVEAKSTQASRIPMGGRQLAPICTFASPSCPPNAPRTH
jgi:hypothetical protein